MKLFLQLVAVVLLVLSFCWLRQPADDAALLQAMIDSGQPVELTRLYYLARPLTISNDQAHSFQGGVVIRGQGAAAGARSRRTGLVWQGPDDQPVIALHSRDCLLQGFVIFADYNRTARAAIEIDQAVGSAITTNNAFRDLWIDGGLGIGTTGHIADGVLIGRPGVMNLDAQKFDGCAFTNLDHAGINIQSDTGQAKHLIFRGCDFNAAPYGIYQVSGSFQLLQCQLGNLAIALSLYQPTDGLLLEGIQSESVGRLIESRGGGSGAFPITIIGGRFETNAIAVNQNWIQLNQAGPLTIIGAHFSGKTPYFRIGIGNGGAQTQAVVTGCQFPNASPFAVATGAQLVSTGNGGKDTKGNRVMLGDSVQSARRVAR